jgi:AraC-like DNA-binding protein
MASVARALGLSARSLRRRLAVEGQCYEQIAIEALAITAKHLLAATPLTVQETAAALGFSHTTTFHRAFKRWTGMTPLAYRTEQLREAQRGL